MKPGIESETDDMTLADRGLRSDHKNFEHLFCLIEACE
jgi:hypothetical protein